MWVPWWEMPAHIVTFHLEPKVRHDRLVRALEGRHGVRVGDGAYVCDLTGDLWQICKDLLRQSASCESEQSLGSGDLLWVSLVSAMDGEMLLHDDGARTTAYRRLRELDVLPPKHPEHHDSDSS